MTNSQQTGRGAAINIRNIKKYYGSFAALDDVSFNIEAGEFMTFLGPSGSGKTTTLNLIAGFTNLTEGEITLGGVSLGNTPTHKRNIGVVFQHYALFPHMTVAKNVAYPLKLRGVSRADIGKQVERALGMVKLDEFAHRYPSELSGGQQQRVALARAMVFDPPLLLMDEPLGALDKKLREWLQMEIKRIHRELGTTFVYVTHDQEEALVLADRIAVFNHGKIEQIGTGRELYDQPKTLFVGQFIGESSILSGKSVTSGDETAIMIGDQKVVAKGNYGDKPAVILVRPEKIRLAAPSGISDSNMNRLTGIVRENIYMGSGAKYEVLLPDNCVVTARVALGEKQFTTGEKVDIEWPIHDSYCLLDDGSGNDKDKQLNNE